MVRLHTLGSKVGQFDSRSAKPAPKEAAPIYHTKEYAAWRDVVIHRADKRCQDPKCSYPWRRGHRLFADHVVEIKDGGAKFDPANGMARCGSCHTRKTAEERANRQAR